MKSQAAVITCCIAALGVVAPAFADDLPRRKAGLWETTMNSAQMQGRTVVSQQCIDDKTDADLVKQSMSGKDSGCSKPEMKRLTNGWEFDSVCKQADGTMSSHGKITGDFKTQYTMDIKGHWTPPREGMGDFQSTITARHLGACPDDMKPGDMKINGMLIHADGTPANLPPEQAEQMRKMMEQLKKQQQKK